MPGTTPNGVSKFLHSRGFRRAEWVHVSNGPSLLAEGYAVEEIDGQISVTWYGPQPTTGLLSMQTVLEEHGYVVDRDDENEVLTVKDRALV